MSAEEDGPATDPHVAPGEPVVESVWIEPYPDEPVDTGKLGDLFERFALPSRLAVP
jgi:hypothetical protein